MTVSRSQPTTDLPWEEYDKPDLVTRQIELMRKLDAAKKALEFIADGYDNHNVNHVDYRVKVYQVALDALEDITK